MQRVLYKNTANHHNTLRGAIKIQGEKQMGRMFAVHAIKAEQGSKEAKDASKEVKGSKGCKQGA